MKSRNNIGSTGNMYATKWQYMPAQGNALGLWMPDMYLRPVRTAYYMLGFQPVIFIILLFTQGVALGWHILPLRGALKPVPSLEAKQSAGRNVIPNYESMNQIKFKI